MTPCEYVRLPQMKIRKSCQFLSKKVTCYVLMLRVSYKGYAKDNGLECVTD